MNQPRNNLVIVCVCIGGEGVGRRLVHNLPKLTLLGMSFLCDGDPNNNNIYTRLPYNYYYYVIPLL